MIFASAVWRRCLSQPMVGGHMQHRPPPVTYAGDNLELRDPFRMRIPTIARMSSDLMPRSVPS